MDFNIILSIIISIILVYVAIQQMITNKNKLKLELYNKRFEVYSSALAFGQELTSNELSSATHRDFISKKESAYFLFANSDDIYHLLEEMHSKSFIIKGFRESAKQLINSPDVYIKAQKEHSEALTWFNCVMPKLRTEMESYLKFK